MTKPKKMSLANSEGSDHPAQSNQDLHCSHKLSVDPRLSIELTEDIVRLRICVG